MARYFKARLLVYALVFLTLLTGAILSSSYTKADNDRSPDDTISCTFTYNEGESRSVSMTNGTYLSDIGNSTMKTICNDTSGYAIYAVGYSNNEFGNNNMIATIDGTLNPTYNISSSDATSGSTSAWAMKVNAITGTYAPTIDNEFGQYRAVPNEYQRLVYLTNTTDDTVGSSISLSYAIYVSGTQPAGNYVGKVKYTLVHPYNEYPCIEGQICYKPNANNVVGKMGKQTTSGTTATLWASNYSHEGYGFVGWNTESDGTGTSYGPNETITLPSDMSEGLVLYAMWVKSAGNLQDWGGCYTMNIGDVTALTDQRDNDTYAIAKLADGKCWMIENLRLDYEATRGTTNQALAQGYGGVFTGLAEPETGNFYSVTTPNSLYTTDTTSTTLNVITGDDLAYRFPRYRNDNTSGRVETLTSNADAAYSYGNYYTFASAIASTDYYNTNNESVSGTSLCPAGWRLPRSGDKDNDTNSDYWMLLVNGLNNGVAPANYDSESLPYYGVDTDGDGLFKNLRKYPNNFVYSGSSWQSSISERGSNAFYWSSTNSESHKAYVFYYNRNGGVYPGTYVINKFNGRSVRCVTASVARQSVTVVFDEGVESVVLSNDNFGTKTITTSGTVVQLAENTTYTISGTYAAERGINGWTTTANGTLGSTTSAETTYVVSGTATLTLSSKRACVGGYICYDKNYEGTSSVGGGMKNQEVDGDDDILWNSNFYRDGYGFAGWNTEPDGSGTMYGPTETIHYGNNASAIAESGLMLYAVWVQSTGYLQDFYCPNNTTMPIGTVTALTDMRDNQVYTVAKLADGKCWMTENLRLNSEYTVGNNINDASVTNEELAQGYGKTDNFGNFIGLADSEGGTFRNRTTANSLYSTDGSTTVNIGSTNNASNRMPRYNNYNLSNPGFNMDGFLKTTVAYRNGNFYTGSAATASTDYYDTIDQNIATSICPTGWRLPTSGRITHAQDGEFYVLAKLLMNGTEPNRVADGADYAGYEGTVGDVDMGVLASERLRTYPTNFTLAGDIAGDEMNPSNQGEYGAYWSSTVGLNDLMQIFTLEVYQDSVYPSKMIQTYLGQSVRCVAEYTGLEGYNYMQDFADLSLSEMDTLKSSMEEGKQYTIRDSRDNKIYHISKLADGNIWMTQNLDLDIDENTTYTPADTDIPSDWTPMRSTYESTATNTHTWCDGGIEDGWLCKYNDTPESYDPGDYDWNQMETDWYDWKTFSGTCTNYFSAPECNDSINPFSTYVSKYGTSQYHLGNYYNYAAAMATNNMYTVTPYGHDVDQSICPAGWRLPAMNNENDEFTGLLGSYGFSNVPTSGSSKLWDQPIYYTLGGYFNGILFDAGDVGNYWSSSMETGTMKRLTAYSTLSMNKISEAHDNSGNGYSVRCVVRTPAKTIEDLGYMQDFADLTADEKTEVLDSMVQDQQYQLVDERDNKVYYVSKLADGKVWMTQNLDLDLDSNTTYTHDDTDLGWGGTLDATATWTPVESTKTVDANGEFPDWINNYIAPVSADPGDWYYAGYDGTNLLPSEYVIYLTSTNRDTVGGVTTVYNDANHTNAYFSDSPFNANGAHGHVGNYYNWSAAVAQNDTSTSNYNGDSIGDISKNPQTSICPAGWRLPTISNESDAVDGSTDEFARLNRLYNNALTSTSSGLEASPLFFTRNGSIDGGLLRHSGYAGMYWSSTYDKPNYAYLLTFDKLYVGPRHAGIFLFEALPVRCVMR